MHRVEYNIGCDGWTEHPLGRIEISDRAWKILSKAEHGSIERVIPCTSGFTDTEHLLAIAAAIDAQEPIRKAS
jgi:hypothetical protein